MNRLTSIYLSGMEARLSRPSMSLSQLAMITIISCVFAAPAIAILSFLVW